MIETIKDLERLLKLCRKQGVTEISLGAVSFKLGELPGEDMPVTAEQEIEDKYAGFPEGALSPEELTFFANGGLPDDNPYRQ